MPLPPDPLLGAIADVMVREEQARVAADREIAADLARARERIDDYGNVIETRFLALEHCMRSAVALYVDGLELKDGAAGPPGTPGPAGSIGDSGPAGPPGPEGPIGYVGQARGLYSAEAAYRAMDVVAFGGSEWRALRDEPGPLPGDGWALGAKGSKGKPGERGERGERGLKGDPGVGLEHVELLDGTLIFTRTDGSALSVDLWPLFADQAAA